MKTNLQSRRICCAGTLIALALIAFLECPQQALAQQWTTSGSNINNTNTGNVGVGTTSPSHKLDVAGNINAGGALCLQGDCKFTWSQVVGAPNQWLTGIGGNNIYFMVGNVGIGLPQPQTKLDVLGTIRGGNANTNLGNHPVYGTAYSAFWREGADYSLLIDGTNTFLNAPVSSGNIYFRSANTDKMILQGSTGRVGIGVTAPAYKLDVNGEINATGLRINGAPISMGAPSQWTTAGSNIHYTAGNVGIGTTNPLSAFQIGTQVAGATASPVALSLGGTYSTTPGANFKLKLYDDGIAGNTYGVGVSNASMDFGVSPSGGYNWYSGGANKMVLTGAGNLGLGTSTPTTKLHVVGDGRVTGNLTVDGNIAAKYQDVAEWVPASEQLPVGTVVVLDSTRSNHVIQSSQPYDLRVAGVISEQPGIALGESGGNKVLVATTGRVKVKVDATRSPIHIGDLLVTSDLEGVAMKSEPVIVGGVQIHRPGTLIGKALEPLMKGKGEILILLSLQ